MTDREKFIVDLIKMNVRDQRKLLELGVELKELQTLRIKKWISQRSEFYSVTNLGFSLLNQKESADTPYKMALPRQYNSMTGVYVPAPHPFKERFRT